MPFRVGITAASYHYANMGQHPLTFLMLAVLSTTVSGLSVHNSTGLRAIPARSSPERHDQLAAGGSFSVVAVQLRGRHPCALCPLRSARRVGDERDDDGWAPPPKCFAAREHQDEDR